MRACCYRDRVLKKMTLSIAADARLNVKGAAARYEGPIEKASGPVRIFELASGLEI
jgi:hypothetical protein